MFSFDSKNSSSQPKTVTGFIDKYGNPTDSNKQKISSLISAVEVKSQGSLDKYRLDDNEILNRFKKHGYDDGLNKLDMNKEVLDTYSLTPNYRYADAYAKGYKQGKEKAIFSTKYGGKSRRHRKGKKHTLRKSRHRKLRGSGALFSRQKPTYPQELAGLSAEKARELGENNGKRDKSLDEVDMMEDRGLMGEHAPQSAYRYTDFLRLPEPSNENERQYRSGYQDGYAGETRRPYPVAVPTPPLPVAAAAQSQARSEEDEDPKNVDGGRKRRKTRKHTKKSRKHRK